MYSRAILAAWLLVTTSAAAVSPNHEPLSPLEAPSNIDAPAHFLKKHERPHDLSLLGSGTVTLGTGTMSYFACGTKGCQLLGSFGVSVQTALWVVVMVCLLTKWHYERPRRALYVFALDIGKLGFGSSYIHILNLLQARAFAEYAHNPSHNNQCAWYLVGIFSDCAISTVLCYYAVELFVRPALRLHSVEFGVYTSDGTRSSVFMSWFWQSVIWCAVITVTRALIAVAVWQVQDAMYTCAMWILAPAFGVARLQLVIALVAVPLVADIFQIWVQDNILKAPAKTLPNWTVQEFDDTLKPQTFDETFSPKPRPVEHVDDKVQRRPAG